MKKILKIISISLFTLFSFYYTEKIIDLSKEKDPIMMKIKEAKKEKEIEPVNAIVTENTILVGKSGKKINVETSYEKMKKIKEYNEQLLEYINIKPTITKERNYEKLITGTNTNKKEISIIFQTNDINYIDQIKYVLNKNSVKGTFFIDGKVIENNFEYMKSLFNNNLSIGIYSYNNIFNNTSVKYVKTLSLNSMNYSNYCLYENEEFLNACKYFKINTIKPEIITKNLYNYLKNNKENGKIYQIKTTKQNIKELNSTLIYLKQKGYKIISLDDLLQQ